MSHLVVVGFKNDRYKANEVLNKLRRLDDEWALDLEDAVAVYRGYDGDLRVDQSYELTTGEGAAWGGLWGSLIGAVLAIPFTGGASAAVAAGTIAAATIGAGSLGAAAGAFNADWWKEDFGISEDFVDDVASMVQPGDSAIFALLTSNPEQVSKQFEGYGGKLLMTTLSNEQESKIQKALNKGRSSATA